MILVICLVLGLFAGCGNTQSGADSFAASKTDSVSRAEPSGSMSEAASASGGQSFAEASSETEPLTEKKSDLVILYTNDVHCSVDDNIGYAGLINYKKSLEADGYEVILLDGDYFRTGNAVKSNQENGLGRSDIDVREKRRKRGMLLEAKKSEKEEDMEKDALEGRQQILDKEYLRGFSGFDSVVCYGISFFRKKHLL